MHTSGVNTMGTVVSRINGVELPSDTQEQSLQEAAYAELLRQQAVRQGLLPALSLERAPLLDAQQREVIESMVEAAVVCTPPTQEECQRHYEANKAQFTVGQALHVRHILFAVTEGVNVHALIVRAEQALLSLLGKDVPEGRSAQLAAELSNCPTGASGGDLGWVGPQDCAPELAHELFHQKHSNWGMGVHPRLVRTRYGFHIIEVLGRRKGKVAAFEDVRERIVAELTLHARARAMHRYMSELVEQAKIEGVDFGQTHNALLQ